MKTFGGPALFLDRSDINTDEIIPAKYLTEISKEALRPHCLEDLKLPGFDARRDLAGRAVIVSRANFGCGSSREHAPWALEMNGIHVVIAESYARIFRQNTFNGGMLAIELPAPVIARLFEQYAGRETTVAVDLGKSVLTVSGNGRQETVPFTVSDFDRSLVQAGGWVDFADSRY